MSEPESARVPRRSSLLNLLGALLFSGLGVWGVVAIWVSYETLRERHRLAPGVALVVVERETPLAQCPQTVGFRVVRGESTSDRVDVEIPASSGSSCRVPYEPFMFGNAAVVAAYSQVFVEEEGGWRELDVDDARRGDVPLLRELIEGEARAPGPLTVIRAFFVLRALEPRLADDLLDARIVAAETREPDSVHLLCSVRCGTGEPSRPAFDICVPRFCTQRPDGSYR